MPAKRTMIYTCTACGKKFGPFTFGALTSGAVEVPVNCNGCKTMYSGSGEFAGNNIKLMETTCKKCKGPLEVFEGICPSCGKLAVTSQSK